MIVLNNITAGYGKQPVLHGCSLTAPAGKVTVLVGPNGCGKSTLLKTVTGLLPVQSGQLLLDGRPIQSYSRNALARQIAYLPQNRPLPDITVQRLVLHGRFPYLQYPRQYTKADLAAAHWAMEQLGIAHLAQEPLARLSGGTQQKVYLAMALTQDTPIIALDEPTTFLDISHRLQLTQALVSLARSGKSVVCVLHDLDLAMETADRLAVMEAGRITAQGTPGQVFATGALEQAFGVRILPVCTPLGQRYVYGPAEN